MTFVYHGYVGPRTTEEYRYGNMRYDLRFALHDSGPKCGQYLGCGLSLLAPIPLRHGVIWQSTSLIFPIAYKSCSEGGQLTNILLIYIVIVYMIYRISHIRRRSPLQTGHPPLHSSELPRALRNV